VKASLRTWTAGSSERDGFTLVEIVAVVAVIALVCGIVLPRLGGLGAVAVETAARRLADAAALARERAVLGGRPVQMIVDLEAGSWRAGAESGSLPPRVRFRTVVASRGEPAHGGVVALDCDPAGSLAARVELTDDRGHGARVLLPAGGGRPRVLR
jgi:prepilin-type N-terminal cleavage/methylation domain-containing protein